MNISEHGFINIMVFVVTLIGSFILFAMDGDADSVENGNTDVEYISGMDDVSTYYSQSNHAPPIRQLNGTLWYFAMEVTTYQDEQAICGYFSCDGGDSYNRILIMDQDDPGFNEGGYPFFVTDAVVTSNNSIGLCVILCYYSTIDNIEAWMLWHWNNTNLSQWEAVSVYASESSSIDWTSSFEACINDTDVLLTGYHRGNYYYLDWWEDIGSRTSTTSYTWSFLSFHRQYFGPWIMCNSTGHFSIGTVYPSSVDYIRLYNFDTTPPVLEVSRGSSSGYRWYDCVITADDTFLAVNGYSTGGGWCDLYHWNYTSGGTRRLVVGTQPLGYNKLGLINNSRWVNIFGYDKTNDEFTSSSHFYYSPNSTWQSINTERWDESEDSTKNFPFPGPRDLFPRIWSDEWERWIYTQLPQTGILSPFSDYDVAGDNEDYHILHSNATTWPAIPWYYLPPPNIVTTTLPSGTFGTWYEYALTGENGLTPYIWSLLSGPAWLSIGSSNGTLYGQPSGTGTFSIEVRLTETHDAPRHDDQVLSLKIQSAITEPGGEDFDVSIPDFIGPLWWFFITFCFFIALMDTVKKNTGK